MVRRSRKRIVPYMGLLGSVTPQNDTDLPAQAGQSKLNGCTGEPSQESESSHCVRALPRVQNPSAHARGAPLVQLPSSDARGGRWSRKALSVSWMHPVARYVIQQMAHGHRRPTSLVAYCMYAVGASEEEVARSLAVTVFEARKMGYRAQEYAREREGFRAQANALLEGWARKQAVRHRRGRPPSAERRLSVY